MNLTVLKTYFLAILITFSVYAGAQKNIIISDSLISNAEQLNVKMGGQGFGKMKVQFGDYEIISSKIGWSTTTTRGNFFNTKSESNSKDQFSFVMKNHKNDTARVEAANYINTKSTHAMRLSSHFSLGSDELQQWSQNFTTLITINADTTDTWALLMNGSAKRDTPTNDEAYLLNGDKKILLSFVTSNKNNDDKRMIPALGYEFIENNRSIAALQYYGGGLLGRNRNIVWMDRSLDEKTKLILSAAMTSILQLKLSEI